MKARSYNAGILESDLYECNTEDGVGITFDCRVVADVNIDGKVKTYVHKTFFAAGAGTCREEGSGAEIPCVRRSRDAALEFAAKVNARGEIDLTHWEELDESGPSLEERLAASSAEENAERHGYLQGRAA